MTRSETPIVIIEAGPRSETGFSSGAYRCLGEDGRYYYVKSPRHAGARALIAEWLAGELALRMALPVRECRLVTIPKELAVSARELGTGTAFGSLELPHADDLVFSVIDSLSGTMKASVLLFDYWVHNEDRALGAAGGKPNMLTSTEVPLALIDHGNAFDPDFDTRRFLGSHAFGDSRIAWRLASKQKAWVKKALAALADLQPLWGAIPETWHENAHGDRLHDMVLENVLSLLHRFQHDEAGFWQPFVTP